MIDGRLCVLYKDKNEQCFIAGNWEGIIKEYTPVQIIPKPKGFKSRKYFYE